MSRLGYSFAPVPEQLAEAVVAGDLPDAAVTLWVLVNRATKGANTYRGSWAELARTIGWTRDKTQRVGLAMEAAGWGTVVRSDGQPGAFLLHTSHGPIVPDDTTGADPEPVADMPQVDPGPVGNLPRDPLEICHDPVGNLPRVSATDLGFRGGIEIESREIASKRAREAATTTTDRTGSPPAAASPLVLQVGQALAESGVTVALVRKPEQVDQVEQLVSMHGVPALVRHARAQYRPERPPASMAAFLPGWSMLPPPRPKPVGPLTRPSSDENTPPAVATEDRSPQVTAQLAEVRARLRERRASTASPESGVA